MNVSNALQTGLIGQNRTLDNAAKPAGDIQGTGVAPKAEEATGTQPDSVRTLQETVVDSAEAAASTKAVTEVSSTIGSVIDTFA
ncbi:MAG: hypothetical protein ACPGPF_03130 [Pontibacterium sp.]